MHEAGGVEVAPTCGVCGIRPGSEASPAVSIGTPDDVKVKPCLLDDGPGGEKVKLRPVSETDARRYSLDSVPGTQLYSPPQERLNIRPA